MSKQLVTARVPCLVPGLLAAVIALSAACDDGDSGPPTDAGDAGVGDASDTAAGDLPVEQPTEVLSADLSGVPDSPAPKDAVGDVADASDVQDAVPVVRGKLDLILLVDNSSSMREEQDALRAAFPGFLRTLAAQAGGLPDLHVGVLSSNFGAGPTVVNAACPVGGDRGAFLAKPTCLSSEAGTFLRVNSANSNVPGGPDQWAATVACLADLGIAGCGYEHQLASLAFALRDPGPNGSNPGFLREDALLAVVILTDEDDCSGSSDDADFYQGIVVGQAGSVRCSLRGHVCGGSPVPPMMFESPLADCKPYERNDATESSSRLINVSTFVEAVKAVKKGRADKTFISTIMGWSEDPSARYRLVLGGGDLDTAPICSHPRTGNAAPGIRLHAFAKAFPNNAVHAICNPDLGVPMADVASKISTLLAAP